MTDYNHLFQYERDIYNPTIRRDPAKLGPDAPPMVRSSIWRKNGDQWQLEFHQVTRVLDAV